MSSISSANGALSSPGIGSGLDVASIVSKLVDIESQPLNDLKSAAGQIQTTISSFGQLQSLVGSLQSAAQKLSNPSLWKQTTATSSNTGAVSITSTSGAAAAGNYTVNVTSLAQSQNLASSAFADSTAQPGAGTLSIQLGTWGAGNSSFTQASGSSTINVSITAGQTLADIRDKINAANAGVTAAIVTDASGARLTIASSSTGLANQVRMTATDTGGASLPPGTGLGALAYAPDTGAGGLTQTQAASDAKATINGLSIQSASNTLSNVLDGATLQLNGLTTSPATVSVSSDTGSATAAINAFVSAYNSLNGYLTNATAYNAATKVAGPLQGDSTATSLRTNMRTLLMGDGGGSSVFARLGDVGFSTAKDGTLSVDGSKLTAAMGNMSELGKVFSNVDSTNSAKNGFGKLFNDFTNGQIGFDGSITSRTSGLNASLQRNQDDQDAMSLRIQQYQDRLNKQYTALDTAMAQMSSLQNYVTQQINAFNASQSR